MGGNNRSGRYAARGLDSGIARASSDWERGGRFRLPPRALPGRRPGLQRELPDRARRPGTELGRRARRGDGCEVTVSPKSDPDVVIGTDAATWLELREGQLSGLDAFRSRRLWARGNLDLAVAFEGFFQLPNGRPPLLRIHEVRAGKARISTLTAGDGIENVILIHGLGSNKTSFFETVSALTPQYTVHAIDLPGFGSSSKPLRAPYDAAWFARAGDAVHGRRGDPARPPGRQLPGWPRRDRGRPARARPRAQPQPALPVDGVAQAPPLRPAREAAAARAGRDPAHLRRRARAAAVLEHVLAAGADPSHRRPTSPSRSSCAPTAR